MESNGDMSFAVNSAGYSGRNRLSAIADQPKYVTNFQAEGN
jgi:hypothetical protein